MRTAWWLRQFHDDMKVVFYFTTDDKVYRDGYAFAGEMPVSRSLAEWYVAQGRGNVVEIIPDEGDGDEDVQAFVNHLAYHEVMRAFMRSGANFSQEELQAEIEQEAKRLARRMLKSFVVRQRDESSELLSARDASTQASSVSSNYESKQNASVQGAGTKPAEKSDAGKGRDESRRKR